jgi:hypothetical protein
MVKKLGDTFGTQRGLVYTIIACVVCGVISFLTNSGSASFPTSLGGILGGVLAPVVGGGAIGLLRNVFGDYPSRGRVVQQSIFFTAVVIALLNGVSGAKQFKQGLDRAFDVNRSQINAPQEDRALGASDAAAASKDEEIRMALVELAASAGDPKAQYMLARKYYDGEGVPKNDAEAARWYQLAADQGNADAQTNLGAMYYKGEGVPKNDGEAEKWFRRAANQGNPVAQTNLGAIYGNGAGLPIDYVEAYFWWNLAAAQGYKEARKNRDIIEKDMTREQITEAQRRSAAWKPKEQ